MREPHGGRLVNRVVNQERTEQLRSAVETHPTIQLNSTTYQDFVNLANGRYSPIKGFMTQNDFRKVVHDMTLEDGTLWTLPIVLDIDAEQAATIQTGAKVGLEDPSGDLIGIIDVWDVYKYNTTDVTEAVYGTSDEHHPGVANFDARDDFLVGGPVSIFRSKRYNDADLLPKETRVLFDHYGWETVAGFQTRNAPHRAHEYIQKSGLEHVDGILLHPKLGKKKSGDYRDDVILGAYETLLKHYYPNDRTALSVFPSEMKYAGPREAVFDALVRKNQGCTHFIIGRDHAGIGDYYGGFEAQAIFEELGDIGIQPIFYNYSFYCERCDEMASEKICPHGENRRIHPSGSKIRDMIQAGVEPSEKIMRPEVTEYIMDKIEPFINDLSTDGDAT